MTMTSIWTPSLGTRTLERAFAIGSSAGLVVSMDALRDVEGSVGRCPNDSPLQQIIEQRNIPEAERQTLVDHLRAANDSINQHDDRYLGANLTAAFGEPWSFLAWMALG